MSVICEFELVSDTLPLTSVAGTLETILTIDDVISGTEGAPAAVFSTTGIEPEELETAMNAETGILKSIALESRVIESRYRVHLDTTHTDVYTQLVALKTHLMGAVVTGRGWKVTAQFANRDGLAAFREACRNTDVDFRPKRIFESAIDHSDDYGLTNAQKEALLIALEEGYFEIPRQSDLSDLAEKMNTTTSALSERLRRGHEQLVKRTIGSSE